MLGYPQNQERSPLAAWREALAAGLAPWLLPPALRPPG